MFDLSVVYNRGACMDKDKTLSIKFKSSEVLRLDMMLSDLDSYGSMNTMLRGIILTFLDEYEQLQQDLADLPDQEAK